MSNGDSHTSESPGSTRFHRRLDKMVKAGRITPEEAERLRAGEGPEAEALIREIRTRHVGPRLDAAVAEGAMTQDEADGIVREVRAGAHPRRLRTHLSFRRRH